MIGYLNGLIIDITPQEKVLTLLTGGVGYRVRVSTELLSRVHSDEKIQLFIHTAVREDDISLYGFSAKEEYEFFRDLLSVSGVGPKIAMDILSAPLHLTQEAIATSDVGLLTRIKGVGKKTAERIIVELKNKITPVSLRSGDKKASGGIKSEALLALESLGYDRMEVVKALSGMPTDIVKTEDMVKYFLTRAS